ncbi:7-cyano-7-deazaguanine synthase [Kitasatospora cineracea]|uniref:7-cyano-7-deazaguanine synthase n=1 Tax=Kitasatospora cineracea TaxID=88074 RepID=UPI0011CEA3A5|nr:7-cyano-7-deazaguanine synthase [Kitasatospora cineracea]
MDPEPWNAQPGRLVEDLLTWLTGDQWQLTAAAASAPDNAPAPIATADDVMLLSGGMDSLCGAADHLADGRSRIHLSHYDASTAIRHAQTTAVSWLNTRATQPIRHLALKVCQTGTPREASSRSRSLLFAALASTVAASASSPHVIVPENGFTSINPPLTAARGGALSTRSTHPGTFARLNQLLTTLSLPIHISNPYAYLTKGQLLTRAHQRTDGGVLAATAATLSCSKLDGARYTGGNPNHNCGLCLACLVRRAAFTDGPYPDPTPYLVDTLADDARGNLLRRRRRDMRDIQQLLLTGIDDTDLLAVGDVPLDTDIDAVMDLCQRGLQELSRVPLP